MKIQLNLVIIPLVVEVVSHVVHTVSVSVTLWITEVS